MIFAFGHDKYTLYQNVANVAKLWFNEQTCSKISEWSPHQESNLEQPLRRRQFYPIKLWGDRGVFYRDLKKTQ